MKHTNHVCCIFVLGNWALMLLKADQLIVQARFNFIFPNSAHLLKKTFSTLLVFLLLYILSNLFSCIKAKNVDNMYYLKHA